MPSKRKISNLTVEDDDENGGLQSESAEESEEDIKRAKKRSKPKVVKNNSADESNSPPIIKVSKEDNKPKTVKKPTFESAENETSDVGADESFPVRSTAEGDKYIDLGRKKRATVRAYKGIPLLDIREFWGTDDDLKPGKKGISLTVDQWEAIKRNATIIDALFVGLKK